MTTFNILKTTIVNDNFEIQAETQEQAVNIILNNVSVPVPVPVPDSTTSSIVLTINKD